VYLEVDGNKYEIVIIKKNNKNTYIRVKDDLKIYVTTNIWTSERQVKKVIEENYDSINKMLKSSIKNRELSKKNMILGHEVDVIKLSTQREPELFNNKFYVKDLNKLEKYKKEYAFVIFKERLDKIYNLFTENIPYSKLKIRNMTTRWGVCNKRDVSITLNLELLTKDIKYLDYVIVHELCHFIHFNHSKDFWCLVSKYCNNYKEIRKEMRE